MEQVEKQWMVIYTKPKNEKKVAEQLIAKGIEVYLPLVETVRQWSDRKKKVQVPLFTSYVFVKTNEHERKIILQIPSILRFVYWLNKPAIVHQKEIDTIKFLLKETANSSFEIENITPGEMAQISQGMFKNQEVEILHANKHTYQVYIVSLGIKLQVSKLFVKK